jgi:hypothetical protein
MEMKTVCYIYLLIFKQTLTAEVKMWKEVQLKTQKKKNDSGGKPRGTERKLEIRFTGKTTLT